VAKIKKFWGKVKALEEGLKFGILLLSKKDEKERKQEAGRKQIIAYYGRLFLKALIAENILDKTLK